VFPEGTSSALLGACPVPGHGHGESHGAFAFLGYSRGDAGEAWGLRPYRSTLDAFCSALDADRGLPGDVRPLVHQLINAFWCHPTRAEAVAWGAYPYDSDQPGLPYVCWPGHSRHNVRLHAATAPGSRGHSPGARQKPGRRT